MTHEQLRRVCETRPFQGFTLLLADGTRVPVPHADFLWMPPTASRTVFIAAPDGTAKIIDLLLVVAIELGNGKAARKRQS